MFITRTPLRISFFGGGTDYPEYFRRCGGQTLGVAINRYSVVIVNQLADIFEHRIRVGYSKTELVRDREEIQHPAVRECLRFLELDGGLEIDYVGDLPARTGLGSSSSFTVGLLHALYAFKGELVARDRLASEAVHVEQEMIGERVGVQDQHICAHGGLVRVCCPADGRVRAEPVPLLPERSAELEAHLMLMYTGIQRHAHHVVEEQLERTRNGELAGELDAMRRLVDQGLDVLSDPRHPVSAFGELLHEGWVLKRGLSRQVSSDRIDAWYDAARRAGAVGGKLLGAGGGGFLLLFAPPAAQEAVARAVPDLRRVPFGFDRAGSSLVFYNPS
jgi:D-glycero-alpha-D-manno-heptose-7-phosphate kinase